LEIAKEIFCKVKFPEDSLFMFAFASSLGRCGTSIYAREWTSVIAQTSALWYGMHICLLVPLIISKCSGSRTRDGLA
jgi:hypothetical protein